VADHVQRARDQTNARAASGRRDSGFGAGVAGTNHDHIELLAGLRATRRHLTVEFLLSTRFFLHCSRLFLPMPIQISTGAPTLFIRRDAYERAGFVRTAIDKLLGSTPDEFRVEGDLVAIGP